jgi:uncharacterized membrane protein
VPVIAGTLRLVQLAGGPALIHADQRFDSSPAPVAVHVVGAIVYAVVGAFQLVPRFRRKHLAWHRRAGRVLAVAGMLVAGSALWMTLFFQQKTGTTDLLYGLRLAFGAAMAACLVLGVSSVRRGDIGAHRAWMIRAYAVAIAAGTQALTVGLGGALIGTSGIRYDVLMGSAWVINLAVAEWAIRRPARLARRATLPVLAAP